jgi:formylglycine-generating enzyme required for sulfatase activity/serine/threonine protein kinase
MADLTLPALCNFIWQNQLLTPGQAQELAQLQKQFPEAHSLAGELVRRGWLTLYQANQLLQGRGAELVLGPYRVLERLGEGGMGQVFRARHIRMDRLVALKVINKDRLAGPKAFQRFTQEARAAARLSHPNIVVAHDSDEVDGRHFLAMEYVDGTDLAKLVNESGPLSVGQACDFARQAALGLQHAHERGVVHRDIKPSNLIVSRGSSGTAPVVKILDFGLGRFDSEANPRTRLTQLGGIVGTVDFVAPEQADNPRTADIRADIYSLGCTLFFLLTGKAAFLGADAESKLAARLVDEPPSPRVFRPEISPALESVLAKMMALMPAQRFQTPAEVATALEPFARSDKVGLASLRPLPSKATERPAGLSDAKTIPPGLAEPPPAWSGAQVAAVRPVITTLPRLPRGGGKWYWPFLAGAAGALLFVGLVIVVLRLRSSTPEQHATSGPVAQGKTSRAPLATTETKIARQKTAKAPPEASNLKAKEDTKTALQKTAKGPPETSKQQGKGGDTKPEPKPEIKPIIIRKGQRLITNSIGMKLTLIPAGVFLMGSPESEPFRTTAEQLHPVRISRPFYMGIYEVTQGQYQKVTGHNPSCFSPTVAFKGKVGPLATSDFPVDQVSWEDAVAFCKKLSQLPVEKTAGLIYRLPTEAEWEYACRAGTNTPFGLGPTLTAGMANIENKLGGTTKVGSYRPNAAGLFDMHGNLWEWCSDWFESDYYRHSPEQDPQGPLGGKLRVGRGGEWNNTAKDCRCANRSAWDPTHRLNYVGFRVVCGVPPESPKVPIKNIELTKGKDAEVAFKKPEPPKLKDKVPAKAAALVAALKGTDKGERVRAAEKLGSSGEKSSGVLRALCEAALDRDDEVKGAALDALEKLSPELYQPVLTLLVDRDHQKQLGAVVEIGRLEGEGASAAPVLAAYSTKQGNYNSKGIVAALFALFRLTPDDPLTLNTALHLARQGEDPRAAWYAETQFAGVATVANLAMFDPALRKVVVPVLRSVLEPSKAAKLGRRHTDEAIVFAIWALAALGKDAREATPALKKLKLHEKAVFRTAAATALAQIEKGGARLLAYTVDLAALSSDTRFVHFKEGEHVEIQISGDRNSVAFFDVNSVVDPAVNWLARAKGSGSFVVPRSGFYRIAIMEAARVSGRFQVTINVK